MIIKHLFKNRAIEIKVQEPKDGQFLLCKAFNARPSAAFGALGLKS
jgi:hypothetical protein